MSVTEWLNSWLVWLRSLPARVMDAAEWLTTPPEFIQALPGRAAEAVQRLGPLPEWAQLDWPLIWATAAPWLDNGFLVYYAGINLAQLSLVAVSVIAIVQHIAHVRLADAVPGQPELEPPVSILVPAYNEEATLSESVRSLQQLDYGSFEIVVINDGSTDGTLERLIEDFELFRFPEVYHRQIPTKPVRAIYHSRRVPNLRVIDKENGGKADSLNAGINSSRNPLFCGVDADSLLQPDSLRRLSHPFVGDRRTVATGGAIRIANGCRVRQGFIEQVGLPWRFLPRMQIVEYMRAFMFGRLGWRPLNAVLIISGAFGMFHRKSVLEVGGYRSDTIGEDMELVVRMHVHLRSVRRPYRVAFIPDSVCWTEAPEDLRTLRNQRIRWQRGLLESLWMNRGLLFSLRGGPPGWLAFPYFLIFEAVAPVVGVLASAYLVTLILLRPDDWHVLAAFITAAVGLGMFVTLLAVLMEELLFHTYRQRKALYVLPFCAIVENLGYRQLNAWWRMAGLWQWLRGKRAAWGSMRRAASWRAE